MIKENVLLYFIKVPVASRVKTRLQPQLTQTQSLMLYKAFVEDSIDLLKDSTLFDFYVFFYPEKSLSIVKKWLDKNPLDMMQFAFLGAGLTYLVLDLIAHARVWRVTLVNQAFDPLPYAETFRVVTRYDPSYKMILAVSALISGISLGFTITRIWKTRRS